MVQYKGPIQVKRGTSAQWAQAEAQGIILLNGELGYDDDLDFFRVGDGITPWSGLKNLGQELLDAAQAALSQATALIDYVNALSVTNDTLTAALIGDASSKTRIALRALSGPVVNVKDFGADPTGVTDSGAAINAALASLQGGPGVVMIPPGKYLVNSGQPINLLPGQSLIGTGNGVRIIRRNSGNFGMIRSFAKNNQAVTTVGLLTADGNKGDRTLSVAATTGIVPGQYIQIFSTKKLSPQANNYQGEMLAVAAVTATTITLANGLSDTYLMSNGAGVRNPGLQADITVANLIVESEAMTSYGAGLIWLQNTLGLRLHNITVRNSGGPGITVDNSVDFLITSTLGSNLADDDTQNLFGYVVNLSNNCENGIVNGITVDNVRHGFTTTGAGGTWAGGPRNIVVENGVARNCPTTAGWDTHVEGAQITFSNLRSYDCAIGFQVRSPDLELIDVSADRCGVGMLLTAGAKRLRGRGITLTNTYLRSVPVGDLGSALVIRQGASESPSDVMIAGLTIDRCGDVPVKFSNVNATGGPTITNVTLLSPVILDGYLDTSGGGAIQVPSGVSMTTLLVKDMLVSSAAGGKIQSIAQNIAGGTVDGCFVGAQTRNVAKAFDGFTPTQYVSGIVSLDAPAPPQIGRGIRPGAGYYYGAPGTTSAGINGEGALCLTPVDIDRQCSLSALVAEITTAGTAGGVFRAGVYTDDGTGTFPGLLVVDAGTIDGTVVGTFTLTLSTAITLRPGRYWVGGAVQGGATTRPTTRNTSNTGGVNMPTQTASANTVAMGSAVAGISGALPAVHPTTYGISFTPPRVMMRLS